MIRGDVDIITVLLETKNKELSINQLAHLLKKGYKTVHNIVKRLEKASIVTLQAFGASSRVELVYKLHPLIFEAEFKRRTELLKDKDLSVMLEYFSGLRSTFFILLIFGSYAKKTNTKHSDIDLMFVLPDASAETLEQELNRVSSIIPLKLHLHTFTESQFKAMKNSKELTVGSEAILHNVILHGIEQYYGLLQ